MSFFDAGKSRFSWVSPLPLHISVPVRGLYQGQQSLPTASTGRTDGVVAVLPERHRNVPTC